jgi:signal transduction histidine kinase
LVRLGIIDEARHRFAELLSLFPHKDNDPLNGGWLDASEVRILIEEGKVEEALAKWTGVQHWLNDHGLDHVLVDIEELLAVALDASGHYKESNILWRTLHEKRVSVARERAQARLSWFKARLDLSKAQAAAEIERIQNVELASAVERLEELHRENEQYVAFLAHELKSPLNTIRAISAMLGTDHQVRDDERMEYGREINRISSRMFDLINQTLEVSKHRLHRTGSVTNARTVWDHVVSALKNVAAEKNIHIDCRCDSTEYLVVSSEQPLVTIMENLLSNAIKFSPEGSTVGVTTRLKGSPSRSWYVHLSVQDQGPGLTPEDAARLFRPFETLTAQPTKFEDSTGLGLHIVQRTVNMLNGRIWCESMPGKGATFHVELPMAEIKGS